MFLLNTAERQNAANYLRQQQWLNPEEKVTALDIPGRGNMNYVVRVHTGSRSFIVKQSRPYVEKYPQVAAPAERVITESLFYKKILAEKDIADRMPRFIGVDTANNIIAMSDLGNAPDCSYLYAGQQALNNDDMAALTGWLGNLHSRFKKQTPDGELANTAMRKLNHEHIFIYPFLAENGFDLDTVQPGLQAVAMPYKNNLLLKQKTAALGQLYLQNGHYLLHGDFYPGSWLKAGNHIKIIDPEFCFFGLREFELGTMMAHLHLTGQPETVFESIAKHYPAYNELNSKLLNGFLGTEIMRRLIGLAQLPLACNLNTKAALLNTAFKLVMEND
jgi:5-methylthioribose kinase